MPLRYQKRINFGKGVGLNLSNSGVSTSYRTRQGSIGTKGFSIKTGIPGLSFRSSWGGNKNGLIILLVSAVIIGAALVIYNLVRLIIYLARRLYDAIHRKFYKPYN